MSGRALETLRQLEVIVAEKPQHSRALMQAFQLGPKRWLRLSAHNENAPRELEKIVEIARSQDVGVVTDAGSPCVSDPGARLVALAFEKGISVTALPGASSAVMAYQLSGFWRSRGFSFHGFLDKWKDSDLTRLETQPCRPWTHVFFVSPHRGDKELLRLEEAFPKAMVLLCFELTKIHERLVRGSWSDIRKSKILWKGECVAVIELPDEKATQVKGEWDWLVEMYRDKKFPPAKDFAKRVAKLTGAEAKSIYQLLHGHR
jgi:16S rRNA (cytidine1402-2'-O)-methyltransferase